MTTINETTIAKYEAKGFRRWTKGNLDRLYINAKELGLEVNYYDTGSVKSAKWQGESISNSDARRLLSSKAYVDVKTGELHVTSSFDLSDVPGIEDMAKQLIASIEDEGKATEPEATETTETICQTIDQLYGILAKEIRNGARAYASGESMTFTGFSAEALDAANQLFATTVESDGAVRAYPFDGSSTFGAYLAEKLDTISWANDGASQQ